MGRILDLRADARLVAVARITIGATAAIAALEAWRILTRVLVPLVVKLPFFSWVPALPAGALRLFLAVWLIAAGAFAIGWKTRLAGAVLTLITGYTLLLDQRTYSNHLYLLVLLILLLTISDSSAAWSLDARRPGERRELVGGWPVLLMKLQVSIVYFFSALAKLTPQYLSGEVLTSSLKLSWRIPEIMSLLAVMSIVAELFIAFALWSSRLRLFAMVAGVGFHLFILAALDSSRLSLGIFALEMFAVYVLFFDPRVLRGH
jgi:hypothetical protein